MTYNYRRAMHHIETTSVYMAESGTTTSSVVSVVIHVELSLEPGRYLTVKLTGHKAYVHLLASARVSTVAIESDLLNNKHGRRLRSLSVIRKSLRMGPTHRDPTCP